MFSVILAGHYDPKIGKLHIGNSETNDLITKIPQDLQHFKQMTFGHVIVMGRLTFKSIGKLLPGRTSIIVSKTMDYNLDLGQSYTVERDLNFLRTRTFPGQKVFVIGGGEIYSQVFSEFASLIDKIYLTELPKPPEYMKTVTCDMFDDRFSLEQVKPLEPSEKSWPRVLVYSQKEPGTCKSYERHYLETVSGLIESGDCRTDRTGTGTLSQFTSNFEIDVSKTVPVLTTKRVAWKSCINELLFFLRGDTDTKKLEALGCNIWTGNTSRAFLDSQGLDYDTGLMGPLYGFQWRYWNGSYNSTTGKNIVSDVNVVSGFDQLEYCINLLRTDPTSRRIVMSAWNPSTFGHCVLEPCHILVQFYTRQVGLDTFLDLHYTMRSNDWFLGQPFNTFSYTVLLYLVAAKTGYLPGKLAFTGVNVHLYLDHVKPAMIQLERQCHPEPVLVLSKNCIEKDFKDLSITDFDLVGYLPAPAIKAKMAV